MNSEISKFQLKGAISVWKYMENFRNYRGWHIYISPEAKESIITLLELMSNYEYASRKALYLSPPNEEITGSPNNYRGLAPYRYKSILFINSKKDWDVFSINENEMTVEFILDDTTLPEFTSTITTNYLGQKNFLLENENKDLLLTFWQQ